MTTNAAYIAEIVRPPLRTRIRVWVACYGASLLWLVASLQIPSSSLWLSATWLVLPAIVTTVVMDSVRKRWWRWLVLWGLFMVTNITVAALVLSLGMGWILSDALIQHRTFAEARRDYSVPLPPGVRPDKSESTVAAGEEESNLARLLRRRKVS